MLMLVPDLHKVMTATYYSMGRGFNRGFVSLMFQHEQRYIFNTTEHGSQRVLRITVDWMRILQQYSYTRGYVWNQYIPLDVQHVLGRPAADPVHAALAMALHHAGTALSRFMPADVQHGLLQYTAQFTIHVKENFDENELTRYKGQATGQDFRIYSSSYTARSYTRDRLGHILIYNGDELYKAEFVKYMVGYCFSSFTTVSDYM